ncbi:protein kinase domain-containing protein [Magnetococcales bacterium HHB-1]
MTPETPAESIDERMIQFLQGRKGFSSLRPKDLARLLAKASTLNFPANCTFIHRGDSDRSMYIIVDGTAEVPIKDEQDKIKFTAHLKQGDIVGEMSLLTHAPRIADVIATTPLTVLMFEFNEINALLHAHPPLARLLSDLLHQRLENDNLPKIGSYHLLRSLGAGKTARVYEGLHPELNRIAAVKMLDHSLVYTPIFLERFRSEARLIACLDHPNIIKVFDTGPAYGTYFIIMEKITGRNLKEILIEDGPLPIAEVVQIMYQLLSALTYAHQTGIIHRDIKPANCMLDQSGLIKLTDFGISRSLDQDQEESEKAATKKREMIEGSPSYLAPEIILGQHADQRADLYALGATLYELLIGHPPFPKKSVKAMLLAHIRETPQDIREKREEIPEYLAQIIHHTLEKKPEKRPKNADELLAILQENTTTGCHQQVCYTTHHIIVRHPDSAKPHIDKLLAEFHTIPGTNLEVLETSTTNRSLNQDT